MKTIRGLSVIVTLFALIISGPGYAVTVKMPCDIPNVGFLPAEFSGSPEICWSVTFTGVEEAASSSTVMNSTPLAGIECGKSILSAITQGNGVVCGKGQSVSIKLLQPQCSSCVLLGGSKRKLLIGSVLRALQSEKSIFENIGALNEAKFFEESLNNLREKHKNVLKDIEEAENLIDKWGIFEVVPVPCKEKEEKKDIKIESKEDTSSGFTEEDLKFSTERLKRIMAKKNSKGGNGKNPDKCIVQPIFPTSGDTDVEPNLYSLESPNAKSNATGGTYLSMPTPSSTLQFTEKGVLPGVELQDAYSGLASS